MLYRLILLFISGPLSSASLEFSAKGALAYEGPRLLMKSRGVAPMSYYWGKIKFSYDNNLAYGKAQIKGDLYKHWIGFRRSYDIKLQTHIPNWPFKKFSAQRADDKYLFLEGLGYNVSNKLGFQSFHYVYEELNVNRNVSGLYIFKEALNEDYLEKRMLRGSTIFKPVIGFRKRLNKYPTVFYDSFTSVLPSFNPANYLSFFYTHIGNENWLSRFWKFLDLILEANDEKFFDSVGDYLNLDLYAKFVAMQLVFGNQHPMTADNLIWLLNDKNYKFEPIPREFIVAKTDPDKLLQDFYKRDLLLSRLISKKGFRELVEREVVEVAKLVSDELDDLKNWTKKFGKFLSLSEKDDFKYFESTLRYNIQFIQQ